ncbi:hypothetical protein PR202_gb15620 [Eleusine coracana subsp. coracana]|uniref:Homeobox domain-containing protein n=1 Tax=Eleusine coracana subsp. coracana TaxID=191504 RepID=A0AAV5EYC3_ELECO|nr:hypothetical protein PR202_gb15620 [Eleusine coracana subsp. coracana]
MREFAEKQGWRINRNDDGALERFCHEIGVRRQVLKVWMHNHKNHHAAGHKLVNSTGHHLNHLNLDAAASASAATGGGGGVPGAANAAAPGGMMTNNPAAGTGAGIIPALGGDDDDDDDDDTDDSPPRAAVSSPSPSPISV